MFTIENLRAALATQSKPAITRWNRLEGRPRTQNFERALQAEVRDALWMLSRQWQLGEFQGDDAGSPVLARVCVDVAGIDHFQAGNTEIPNSLREPLEVTVEKRPLPLNLSRQYLSLDLRLAVGMRWLKLLRSASLSKDYVPEYLRAYGIQVPHPAVPQHAAVCAHAEVWQQVSAAAGRMMDGVSLLDHLKTNGQAFDLVNAAAADKPKLVALGKRLQNWFATLILQPESSSADSWDSSRLEYKFGCSAAMPNKTETVMRADEYYQGHLDWYALEERSRQVTPLDQDKPRHNHRRVHEFIPTSIVFDGMPNTRWWAFENRRTNFGEMRPDITDLGKVLLMEFGLVYANDWFIIPCKLPVGSVAQVKGIALSNVFGERFWIEPVTQPTTANWDKWTMFTLTPEADEERSPQLVLLPTLPKKLEGPPIEQVALIRDEMANMVWGVELKIPLASGGCGNGRELSRELFKFLQEPFRRKIAAMKAMRDRRAVLEGIPTAQRTLAEQEELDKLVSDLDHLAIELVQVLGPDPKAPIRYEVMNRVPEHWIPFIPVTVNPQSGQIRLQRAALPRILEGDTRTPPEKVRPRTTLLQSNFPRPYYIHEEEVPRAGVVVSQAYQRTRWVGGKVFTWLGARKQTGRGEGASGLKFDFLTNTDK